MYVCMYDYEFSLTLSWAWILAPFSASSATTSERPFKAAVIRGVNPSYHEHENIRLSHTKVLTHILWCYLECYGQTVQTVDRIIFINIRIYSFIHLHTYIHIYMHSYIHTQIHSTYINIYINLRSCIHTYITYTYNLLSTNLIRFILSIYYAATISHCYRICSYT